MPKFEFLNEITIRHNETPRFLAKVIKNDGAEIDIKLDSFLEKVEKPNAQLLAKIMRELGEWYNDQKT